MKNKRLIFWLALSGLTMVMTIGQFGLANSQTLVDEHFNADVISSGVWVASDPAVSIDTVTGLLHVGEGFGYSGGAFLEQPLPLPLEVEVRMRLTGGSAFGYTLPVVALIPLPDSVWTWQYGNVYLPGGEPGGWQTMNVWTGIQLPSVLTGEWVSVRIEVYEDRARLYVKKDSDSEFAFVADMLWVPAPFHDDPIVMAGIALRQPWDATCEFDYVRVTSIPCHDRLGDYNCDGVENAVDLALLIDRIFFGGAPACPCPSPPLPGSGPCPYGP